MNSRVAQVGAPPIAEANRWLADPALFPDKPLLNLAQAVPGYPPAESLRAHVAQISAEPETGFYTAILGLPELRTALGQDLGAQYGASIAGDDIAITSGCNQAFCAAISAIAGVGDEVILATPYYFNHQMWLDMQGIHMVPLECDRQTCLPSIAACEALIGPRTRAIVLVSPNNPTGAIYSHELLADFCSLAAERGIALVLDETYRDFVPSGLPHRLFDRPDWRESLISLHSFSKSFSLTGYRVGAIVASPGVLANVEKILDCFAICPSHLSQRAALFGLQSLSQWRQERCGAMMARAQAFTNAFERSNVGYQLLSCGAFFGYVQHPFEGESSLEVAKRLAAEQNVLCLPGTMFGAGQEAYLRFSFTNVAETAFDALVDRLIESQG